VLSAAALYKGKAAHKFGVALPALNSSRYI
jgi:hypothetical protein